MLKPLCLNYIIFYFIAAKKKKKLNLEDLHSDQSESDEDRSPGKIKPNFVSSDRDLESYNGSSRRCKKPASKRPFMRKGIFPKITPSFSITVPQQQKGIL